MPLPPTAIPGLEMVGFAGRDSAPLAQIANVHSTLSPKADTLPRPFRFRNWFLAVSSNHSMP